MKTFNKKNESDEFTPNLPLDKPLKSGENV